MSSRGSKSTNGHVTTTEYKMKSDNSYVYDAKILVGQNNAHSLPDYSHTPGRIYIKENQDGSFREMRIYGSAGEPLLEIGFHGEKRLTGSRNEKVLHYHLLTVKDTMTILRSSAVLLNESNVIYKKYEKYLKEYGL